MSSVKPLSEIQVETKARNRVREELGIPSTKLNVRGQRGELDVLFWLPGGKPLIIEFKKPGEEPTAKQWDRILQLRKLGYAVEWCDNSDVAYTMVENLWLLSAKRIQGGPIE